MLLLFRGLDGSTSQILLPNFRKIIHVNGGSSWGDVDDSHDADDANDDGRDEIGWHHHCRHRHGMWRRMAMAWR